MLTKIQDESSLDHAQTQAQHHPTAILIRGADGTTTTSSTARGEGLVDVLSSQGFAVRELGAEAAETGAGLSEAVAKLTVPPLAAAGTAPAAAAPVAPAGAAVRGGVRSSRVLVFDLIGRGGREMALACEEAGVAGFYALRPSTGMFKKVRYVKP